ncbi:peptidoglycan-binding protein LysM [Sphingomicrobium aestuariivivum]|uniref:peptidoglycan-binding protein LysM n=1 Tax=Sphingomicrobium aestuariivivum TaxID=1582356 RepID=UPI001FD6D843|nr:peptidoglycan-binding protein LysM [Sphingomicrobium aestuariivivum]MCJ8191807.1 peptidoglycan-binding protein LysM [Sphingomicrobium aestuariivivum]
MGLFDIFKKDDGKELFDEASDAEVKAESIRREIDRMGLEGDIKVRVEGDKVKISGKVPDQATKEKLMAIAGNTKHISGVDDGELAATRAGTAAKWHRVESGDTLSKIAKEEYGDANAYMRIFEANRPMLEDPDKIYPGQVLRIPQEEGALA